MPVAGHAVGNGRTRIVALLTIAAAGVPVARAAAAGAPAILQVPYVAQSELLCGGAAVAMVERWWGRRGVYAAEFASLVHRDAGGIYTADLLAATRARGWEARAVDGTPMLVQQSLRDSIPVVALIKVRHNRFHYVVILGWGADVVTYHDPAVGPFLRMKVTDFLERWRGGKSWMMVMEPPTRTTAVQPLPTAPSATTIVDSMPCRPFLDQAADAAAANQLDQADQLLATAAERCATEPLVLRELAGVRFRQGRRADAARLAAEYVQRVPSDTLGWQLLASSRYLSTDLIGALQAWNVIGRPPIDLVRIDGIHHIRYLPVAEAIALPTGSTLTAAGLALAQRRLADVPAIVASQLSYAAVEGGAIEVRAAVAERPVVAPLVPLLVNGLLRAAIRQDVELAVNSPLGAGEQWTAQWRWENADPRQAIALEIPTRIGMPGVVSVASDWRQFRFSDGVGDEQLRATTLGFSNWITSAIEMRATLGYERWDNVGNYLGLSLGTALHLARDQVVIGIEGESSLATVDVPSFYRVRSRAGWLSKANASSITWAARLGFDWASADTPLGLRPIAGGDLGRDIPLRAHQFIVNDRLPAARIGQGIAHGGAAADRPFAVIGPVVLGAGIFVDAAQVIMPGDGSGGETWYLDGGAGLRIGLGEGAANAFRIDLARGLLADPRWAITVGYEQTWPPRLHRAH